MVRVAGTDPGTSSLDVVVLEDGHVVAERRFDAGECGDPVRIVSYLESLAPLDVVAAPSGYGIPLKSAGDVTEADIDLMTLVRPDERGRDQGVVGFRRLLRSFATSKLPVVFLPGVVHLASVPAHRKINRVDLGTADKLCVAALALWQHAREQALRLQDCNLCVVELGSAFTAVLVIASGRLIDGFGGTSGPLGWSSGGAWDGEVAYLVGPLEKRDLFEGGVRSIDGTATADRPVEPDGSGVRLFRESLVKTVAAARAIGPFDDIVLSGRLLDETWLQERVMADLSRFGRVRRLAGLAGSKLKHAAQGAAIVADGVAGGACAELVNHLGIREASGSALDGLCYSGAAALRAAFGFGDSAGPA